MRKLYFFITLCTFLPVIIFANNHEYSRDPLNGVMATPTSYVMGMKKMEFSKDNGQTWVTFAEGSGDFDIASVAPGGTVGAFGKGKYLAPGTYTKLRVTISKYFKVKASVADAGNGQPARTEKSNPSNGTYDTGFGFVLTNLGVCSTDGGTPTLQTIPIPVETDFPEEDGSTFEIIGDTFRFTENMDPFTIPVGQKTAPSMRLVFDVTDSVSFKTTGAGTAVMMVLGPMVTMTITP